MSIEISTSTWIIAAASDARTRWARNCSIVDGLMVKFGFDTARSSVV
jgi:hypothetical protein